MENSAARHTPKPRTPASLWSGRTLALSGKKFALMNIEDVFAVGYIGAHIGRAEENADGNGGSFQRDL